MTARRSRSRRAAYAALALALAGSLALTGCNSHSSKSRKSKKSFSSSARSKSSLKSKKRGFAGGGAAGAGAGAAASRRAHDCRPSTYRVTFAQQTGPKSHVTVTFKNTGGRACTLHDAPLLRFDNAKAPLPLLQGTPGDPDGTRVTVPAHGHAYAVVPTRTAAAKGTTRRSVTVAFMGASAHSVTAEPVTVNFAEKRLHLSVGNSKVTNWNSSLHAAQLAGGVAK
ncbi:DUF4232 domain-containing protein [Streptomyces angustmyceticus]|uniref:DUF4232 domain-containing protein n=1 Tax=Streptomyces angustmyceticus TaxID=285578 RepID=A0A5J4LJG0_9ACTN|nr:DUF4232 domain-containing protein [Streptomyces angustmyceticus]UAL68205.1 DUF4232 domain-containing protein [Streptomyces angustmyceticus]GES31650.1 hypothetical protein San01_41370 [Streptomyces angustmyceticus]